MSPLCFILMPLGRKPARNGRIIDFDAVYSQIIKPAVIAAGLVPLRADEGIDGNVIHKAMFEQLILCDYAVADLTLADANTFYELGLRHALRPWTTQLLFAADGEQLPFDVKLLRAQPYRRGADGTPSNATLDRDTLAQKLLKARQTSPDSPMLRMMEDFPDIQRLKTDVFRDREQYDPAVKARLAAARRLRSVDAVAAVETELGDIGHADAAVVIDLFLSYRAVEAWEAMVALAHHMAAPLAATVMVREQLALAANRAGRGEEAEAMLLKLIEEHGASSETCGILGRVYKDRWEVAAKEGKAALARGLLEKAIDAYLRGFEADWRDAYPGVNALTLMARKDTPDPRQTTLLPVVTYAVERRIAGGGADYWDYATRLELAVLARDMAGAEVALADALAHQRESWETKTTARNLGIIAAVRHQRGEDTSDVEGLIAELP